MANSKILFILLALVSLSCKSYSPEEYLAWVENEENGLIQKKNIAGIEIKASFRPENYNMLKELGPENSRNEKRVEEFHDSNGALQFYELEISNDSVDFIQKQSSNVDDYHDQLYYFTFSFKDDIKLIYPGKDTLSPIIYHFERAYSLSNKKKMIVAFELPEKDDGDRVVQIDCPLLPTGVVNLYFSQEFIKDASKLKLKYEVK